MLSLKESLKHYTTVQLRKALSNYNKSVKISGYSKLARSDLENLIILNASKFQHMILEKAPEEKKKVKKPMVKKEEKPVVKEEEKKEVKPMVKKEEKPVVKEEENILKNIDNNFKLFMANKTGEFKITNLDNNKIIENYKLYDEQELLKEFVKLIKKYKPNEMTASDSNNKLILSYKSTEYLKNKKKEEEDFNKLLKSLEEIIEFNYNVLIEKLFKYPDAYTEMKNYCQIKTFKNIL